MIWICAQIGAREHYAVPRVLYGAGKLESLYTDFWASALWRLIGKLAGKGSLATRCHADLIGAPVTGFNFHALKVSRQRFTNPYEGFLKVGEAFGRGVVRDFEKRSRVERRESRAMPAESRDEGRESRAKISASDSTAIDARLPVRSSAFSLQPSASSLSCPPPNSQLPASNSTVFFGYDTGFLEPARWVKEHGGKTIVCQMDPARYEVDLVKEEEKRWPGWAKRSVEVPEAYFRRRQEEWAVADLVMVNSEWTKAALMKQGVSDDKIVVVPLAYEVGDRGRNLLQRMRSNGQASKLETGRNGYEAPPVEGRASRVESNADRVEERRTRDESYQKAVNFSTSQPFNEQNPLRVLFLGQVILRKGIQYLIEAAKLLKNEAIHFDIVGPIGISDQAVASAPSNMTFHGPVSRDRTDEFYRSADLFVLPTLSDGFALTQLEAMAHGLPVIATPNCGEVVTDGVDGLIVPASDSNALAEAFQLLIQDPEKLRSMSEATKAKVEQFSLARLGGNLADLEQRLL